MHTYCQEKETTAFFITSEILIGETLEANTNFPETNLQKAFVLNLGKYHFSNEKEWYYRLKYPKTGISLAIIDFGNTQKIGKAYTIMPFIEFGLFRKKSQRWNLFLGAGGSYMDTQFDATTNANNQAITTKLNWSFRSFMYYDIYKNKKINWRLGLGYFHHSNGHTRLPNQGLNSILASVSAQINTKPKTNKTLENPIKIKTHQTYFSIRAGVGQNVLSETFNAKREVFSVAISAGKIINKTFKLGGGLYYRYYENYYDYIKKSEYLIEEQVPHFRDNPYKYATNYGIFGSAELLLDHFGFEFDIGISFYKPFYKIDWQLNQGYSFQNANGETIEVLGELNSYYKLKKTVPIRAGLKYYLFSNNTCPKHNLYIAAHINANLGQADFTELSLGYVYRLNLKNKE
ncbi:acyloxyacyl hydrolase [Ichthyenterobacterium magnum]|uniref:Lipid A 3-O-deacylase PagL n=1 Tax=Ichthyenterobacterium magnum TaxID=1230530 RepID=A0A420DF61_9FLAO|nr:acyloxyacyl hydrolase [Ichthyenterobacterium magnum]RKE90903.1 lipid A 3-O-deacylase PagL [Ichthyenterobacterium magnum]